MLLNEKDSNRLKIVEKPLEEFGALTGLNTKISRYLLEEDLCSKSSQAKEWKFN